MTFSFLIQTQVLLNLAVVRKYRSSRPEPDYLVTSLALLECAAALHELPLQLGAGHDQS
jgi:hypothetical protein